MNTNTTSDHLHNVRHSCAHLLAAAVKELWPGTHNAIGPAIDNGFYQDFDFGTVKISEADFPKIEERMQKILESWGPFVVQEVSVEQAKKDFAANPYKLELINEFAKDGKTITENNPGGFLDLCKGGHAENPSHELKNFKLLSVAGAYWRGDEKNKMLTRIYGVVFSTPKELRQYLQQQEEAKKRDHRKLGKELELFALIDEIGPGLPLFYPKGATMRTVIEQFVEQEQSKRNFKSIWIPHIAKGKLYETSGHLGKYDAMFPPMKLDETDYYLKPMNCPHFMMLYKSQLHSYRDLPMRWTATTTVYRNEKSGEVSGLTRVRALTQDDCHVFMRPDQIEQELNVLIDLIEVVYNAFGLTDFWVSISTRDAAKKDDYLGNPAVWDNAEATLESIIGNRNWDYKVVPGEAAFYGPKLDFMAKDAIGREWQLSTLQLDFNLPERFGLEYVDEHGEKHRPVVIHRALLGSVERWLGVMIEHFAGNFPVWLAPVQVQLVAVSEHHVEHCQLLLQEFQAANIRVELNSENETVGNKIRKSTQQKIPYILVIGDKEIESTEFAIRKRGQKETSTLPKAEFIEYLQKKIESKDLTL